MSLASTTLVTFEAQITTTVRLTCEVAVDGTRDPATAVFEATNRLHRSIGNQSPGGIAFTWNLSDVQEL